MVIVKMITIDGDSEDDYDDSSATTKEFENVLRKSTYTVSGCIDDGLDYVNYGDVDRF